MSASINSMRGLCSFHVNRSQAHTTTTRRVLLRPLIHAVLVACALLSPSLTAAPQTFAKNTVQHPAIFEEDDGLTAAVDNLDIYTLWKRLLNDNLGLQFPLYGASDWRLHAIDVNNDQRPDLLAHSPSLGQIRIGLRRQNDFEWPDHLQQSSDVKQAFVLADFDGDDYLDFAQLNPTLKQIQLLPGEGGHSLHPNWLNIETQGQELVESTRFLNDDQPGLVGIAHQQGKVWIARNQGSHFGYKELLGFTPQSKLSLTGGEFLKSQKPSWVISDPSAQKVWLFWHQGGNEFRSQVLAQLLPDADFALTHGHFLNLERESLALLDRNTGELKVGHFDDQNNLSFSQQYQFDANRPWQMLSADFNRDGRDDLLVYESEVGQYKLLLNTNTATPEPAPQVRWLSNGALLLQDLFQ